VEIKVYNPKHEVIYSRNANGKGKFSLTTQDGCYLFFNFLFIV